MTAPPPLRGAGRMPDPETVPRPWLDAYPPGVPADLVAAPVTLPQLLDDAARDFPFGTAIVGGGAVELTWQRLRDRVARLATVLRSFRVGRGTRVAVALAAVPAAVETMFAVWRLGAAVVPVDPMLPDAELRRRLETTGVELLVCARRDVDTLAGVAGGLQALRVVAVTGRRRSLTARLAAAVHRRVHPGAAADEPPAVELRDLDRLVEGAGARRGVGPAAPGDVAVLQHSAGRSRSGRPAVLTHANLVAAADQARSWTADLREGRERLLCTLPPTHPAGLAVGVVTAVRSASTLVLAPSPEPGRLLAVVAARRPTLMVGPPATYRGLVDLPGVSGHDLTSLRVCLSTGGGLPDPVTARFERLTGARLRSSHGLAEAAWLTHAEPVTAPTGSGGVGLPVPGTVAAVIDPSEPGRPLPPGSPGRLAVRGPQVMDGHDDAPSGQGLRDGWLLTGDVVVMEVAGTFRLVGRDERPVVGRGGARRRAG